MRATDRVVLFAPHDSPPLRDLAVVAIDCQATGATPAQGALLEIGWGVCRGGELVAPARACWVVPPEGHRVPRVVRQLTGFDERCLAEAKRPEEAWAELREDLRRFELARPAPCVIHFARFELSFLRDLHARPGEPGDFPLDTVCLHEIARRLYPDLPRRSLRALAGYLGHSTDLARRCKTHVEASAFVWRQVLVSLEAGGVRSWPELLAWLDETPAQRGRRTFPMPPWRRRTLPDAPGVYRFLRTNGDVLYVGKATSLKQRVAQHFGAGSRTTERALEMLTQARELETVDCASALEAAVLEVDEIRRLDPPYNVQLRESDPRVWFSSPDLRDARERPDGAHAIGPLPSRAALEGLAALRALLAGEEPDERLRSAATLVARRFCPDRAPFESAWRAYAAERGLVPRATRAAWHSLLRASVACWVDRAPDDERTDEGAWDAPRIVRHLDRALAHGGLLLRRARWLCALCDASLAVREAGSERRRNLVLVAAEIRDARDLAPDEPLAEPPAPRPWRDRQMLFDRVRYDRLRVLTTELKRVVGEGGDVELRSGRSPALGRAALAHWFARL